MCTAIHWFWCKPVPGSRTWKIGRAKSGSFYCQTWKGVQYSVCSRDRRLVSEYKKRDHLWVVVSRSHLITSLITTITREVSTLPSYKNYKL